MAEINENIRKRRLALRLSQDELAAKLGYTNRSTIAKIEAGINDVTHSKIIAFAKALETTPAYLMGWGDEVTFQDEEIPLAGPFDINAYIAQQEQMENVLTKIPFYDSVVSAGNGAWLADGHEYTYLYLEDVPESADFALRVRGDSMEPMYSDDDIVFVRANTLVESGQIGVFCLNDEGYLKMLQGNKLVSLNENYKPVIMNEWDNYFCAGRVVGKTRIE